MSSQNTDASTREMLRANTIFARTMFNEMVRAKKSRADIVEVVNALLSCVLDARGFSSTEVMVDPDTGFPTRQGFLRLIQHELDPDSENKRSCSLIACEFDGAGSGFSLGLFRHRLRGSDVVCLLEPNLVVAVVYCEPKEVQAIAARMKTALPASVDSTSVRWAIMPLLKGEKIGRLWRAVRTELSGSP